jgi:hypothetical protein
MAGGGDKLLETDLSVHLKKFEDVRRTMNPSPGGAQLLSPARQCWEY